VKVTGDKQQTVFCAVAPWQFHDARCSVWLHVWTSSNNTLRPGRKEQRRSPSLPCRGHRALLAGCAVRCLSLCYPLEKASCVCGSTDAARAPLCYCFSPAPLSKYPCDPLKKFACQEKKGDGSPWVLGIGRWKGQGSALLLLWRWESGSASPSPDGPVSCWNTSGQGQCLCWVAASACWLGCLSLGALHWWAAAGAFSEQPWEEPWVQHGHGCSPCAVMSLRRCRWDLDLC